MKRLLPKLPGYALDAFVLWAIGVVRSWAQWRGRPSVELPGVEALPDWWWRFGSLTDLLLMGPDAGNWAANAQAALSGQPLDVHRLPTYTFLTAATTRIFDDVAFAGHAVNHLASGLLAVVVYAFGRALGGRGPAAAAALLVALCPILINAKLHFGVDPTLHLALWGLFTLSLLAARGRLWLSAAAGVLAGVCLGTHYLGMLFPLPMAALIALGQGRWWRRLAAPALMLGTGWLTWRLLMLPYPPVSLATIASVYAEGVAGSGASAGVSGTTLASATAFVQERAPGATSMAVQRGLRAIYGVPWALLLPLFWLGLFGPGLAGAGHLSEAPAAPIAPGEAAEPARWRRVVSRVTEVWDPLPTLFLVTLFAPLVLMEAARAPERYTLYGLPLAFLLVARGAASVCAGLDAGLRRAWGGWPRGLLAVFAGAALVMASQNDMRLRWPGLPPTEDGVQDRGVGWQLSEAMPASGEESIATSSQNLPFYTGRRRCPSRPCDVDGELVVARCAAQLLAQCPGRGALPYVVEERSQHGFADKPNTQMDEAISAAAPLVAEAKGRERSLRVYAVERETLEALATVDGARLPAPTMPPQP